MNLNITAHSLKPPPLSVTMTLTVVNFFCECPLNNTASPANILVPSFLEFSTNYKHSKIFDLGHKSSPTLLKIVCYTVHFKFDTQRCVSTKLHILRECLDLKAPSVMGSNTLSVLNLKCTAAHHF